MLRISVFSMLLLLCCNGRIFSMGGDHSFEEGLGDWYLRDETRHHFSKEEYFSQKQGPEHLWNPIQNFDDLIRNLTTTIEAENNNSQFETLCPSKNSANYIIEIKEEEHDSQFTIKHPNIKCLERFKQAIENHLYDPKLSEEQNWKISWTNGNTNFILETSKSSQEIRAMLDKVKTEILTSQLFDSHD